MPNTVPHPRRLAVLSTVVLTVTAFLVYATAATPTITTRFGGGDGGELAAVAVSGGVAHPSGYPAYLVLARAFLRLPFAEPAAALAMLSVVTAAVAVGLTSLLIALSLTETDRQRGVAIAGSYTAACLMLSERLWSQAIIVEVYAPCLMAFAACSVLVIEWLRTRRARYLAAAAFGAGVALGTHLMIAALLPAIGFAWQAASPRPRISWRELAGIVVVFVLGSSIFVLLPIWSARETVPSWGNQQTLAGFWEHVTGAEYRYLITAVPLAQRLTRIRFVAADLLRQPGVIPVCLATWWGLPFLWQHSRALLALTGTIALLSITFAVSYGGADGTIYLLPWTWAWCLWSGAGLFSALAALESRRRQRTIRSGVLLMLSAVLIWNYTRQRGSLDLHADYSERQRISILLQSLPADAILITNSDADTFGSWYAQQGLGMRRDVLVVDQRLFERDWYRTQLARTINVKSPLSLCQSLEARAKFEVVDDTTESATSADYPWKPQLCEP